MVFSTFTKLCNYCHNPFQNIFIIPKRIPISISNHFPASNLPASGNEPSFPSLQMCLFWRFIRLESYNMWTFVPGFLIHIMFSRFIHVQHVSVVHSFLLLNYILFYGVQKRVNIPSPKLLSLESPVYKIGPWLASKNLYLGRFAPFPNQ